MEIIHRTGVKMDLRLKITSTLNFQHFIMSSKNELISVFIVKHENGQKEVVNLCYSTIYLLQNIKIITHFYAKFIIMKKNYQVKKFE